MNGQIVSENKLVMFLNLHVLSREFRTSRYSKNRATSEWTAHQADSECQYGEGVCFGSCEAVQLSSVYWYKSTSRILEEPS